MNKMTSAQRVMRALEFNEPDYVPLILPLTMHGAKELGLSLKEYYSKPENLVEGQMRMSSKYGSDVVISYFYTPLEYEAWGGETFFRDDGPPNSTEPVIKSPSDIDRIEIPDVHRNPATRKIIDATAMLAERCKGKTALLGVVTSPFSLPIMQLGFDKYFDLMFDQPDKFRLLIEKNTEFCVELANAQFDAGAMAVIYVDPMSSTTVITPGQFREYGLKIAQNCISRFKGASLLSLASGRSEKIAEDIMETGAVAVLVSVLEDLKFFKDTFSKKTAVAGGLNGIAMRKWDAHDAENAVKDAIRKAGKGGGFIICDSHGEIPFQVDDEILHAVVEARRKWGRYPLKWIEDE